MLTLLLCRWHVTFQGKTRVLAYSLSASKRFGVTKREALLLKFIIFRKLQKSSFFVAINNFTLHVKKTKIFVMKLHNIFHNDLPEDIRFEGSIAIDTEAMGLNIPRDRLCLCQISDENQNVYFVKFDGKDYTAPNLRKVLQNPLITKIFHYARFDVGTLCHYLNIPAIEPIFCTKIASKLVRTYTDAHGLKTLCRELLGVELEKESQISYWGAEKLTEKQKKYAANDVLHLHKLKEILEERLNEAGRMSIAQKFFDVLNTVSKCEVLGFDPAFIINHH